MSLTIALPITAAGCLSGCGTLQHAARRHGLALTEASWQALHVLDFAQTVTIARQVHFSPTPLAARAAYQRILDSGQSGVPSAVRSRRRSGQDEKESS